MKKEINKRITSMPVVVRENRKRKKKKIESESERERGSEGNSQLGLCSFAAIVIVFCGWSESRWWVGCISILCSSAPPSSPPPPPPTTTTPCLAFILLSFALILISVSCCLLAAAPPTPTPLTSSQLVVFLHFLCFTFLQQQ